MRNEEDQQIRLGITVPKRPAIKETRRRYRTRERVIWGEGNEGGATGGGGGNRTQSGEDLIADATPRWPSIQSHPQLGQPYETCSSPADYCSRLGGCLGWVGRVVAELARVKFITGAVHSLRQSCWRSCHRFFGQWRGEEFRLLSDYSTSFQR